MKFQVSLALLAAVAAIAPPILAEENFGPEFAALKTQYDLRVKSDVQQVFAAGIVDLNIKYTASLDRAFESAQKAGRLDDALALKSEKEAIAIGKGVPIKDDEKTPAELKQLRDVYRASANRLEVDRAKRLQPLQATFIRSLETVVSHLTTEGKLEEATAVKKYRDGLNAPVPPPAIVGQVTGSGAAALGTSTKNHIATAEQLMAKKWQMSSSKKTGVWIFTSDKIMTSSSGFKATWSIKGRTLYLDWGKGGINQYSLELQPSNGDLILRGMDAAGKPTDSTLTQSAK